MAEINVIKIRRWDSHEGKSVVIRDYRAPAVAVVTINGQRVAVCEDCKGPAGSDPCGECGHTYGLHDGYSRGPSVAEWCTGGGVRPITIDGEHLDDEMLCRCAEFVPIEDAS